MSKLAMSNEYQSFRSCVPQKRVVVEIHGGVEKVWTLYDFGPREVRCPLICFPPASGTADVYYQQILSLSAEGYRVISVDYPICWDHDEFCESFLKLLDLLLLDQVHIFGASLGGFLAQKFAEKTAHCQRVQSLILCNAFTDTDVFSLPPVLILKAMPAFMLKRLILQNYPSGHLRPSVADSVDFMVERLSSLPRKDIASRLALNSVSSYIEPQFVTQQGIKITLMTVFDECAVTSSIVEELEKCYPEARPAHLKHGGNFPYLSAAEDLNMHLRVHLRCFMDNRYSACAQSEDKNENSSS